MRRILASGLVAFLAANAPASAQEVSTSLHQFNYYGNDLLVEVLSPSAGELHVIRGEAGLIRVRSAAAGGFTAAGLQDNGRHLSLTAVGGERGLYLVVVPDNAYLRVALPGIVTTQTVGANESTAIFRWGGPAPTREAPGRDAPVLIYSDPRTPSRISIPDPAMVGKVTVRQEGSRFELLSDRGLKVHPGSHDLLEIRPARSPVNLTIRVPAASNLRLAVEGTDVLAIQGGEVSTLCTPTVAQTLADGRSILVFAPRSGITCPARGVVAGGRR